MQVRGMKEETEEARKGVDGLPLLLPGFRVDCSVLAACTSHGTSG